MLRKLFALLTLGALLVISGCTLRIDTGTPAAKEPDAQELARRSAVSTVAKIQSAATSVANQVSAGNLQLGSDADTEVLAAVLNAIEQQSGKQLELLGPLPPETSETADGAEHTPASPEQDVSLRKLGSLIEAGSEQLRADLETADPELARLLGSITASVLTWQQQLALLNEPEPDSEATQAPAAVPAETFAVLATHPTDSGWIPLISSWDRIAYLLEIAAARGGDSRQSLANAAAEYRDRSQAWAQALGVAGGDSDPRLASYSTPELTGDFEKDVSALQAAVRAEIVEITYQLGDLLFTLPPAEREIAVAELANISQDIQRWGINPALMPGLREQPAELVVE